MTQRYLYAQMAFSDIKGNVYRADIMRQGVEPEDEDGNPSWTPLQLTAAGESCFEVSDDEKENLFAPVHCQTGYMSIVCDSDFVGNLFPSNNLEFKVMLYRTGEADILEWMGFIKAESYTTYIWDGIAAFNLALLCPLSVIRGGDMPTVAENHGIWTIRQLLEYCFSFADCDFGEWLTTFDASQFAEFLGWKVNSMNWAGFNDSFDIRKAEGEENRRIESSADCLEVVSDVCRYLGLSLSCVRGRLLFYKPDGCDVLTGLADSVQMPVVDMASLDYIGTSHTRMLRAGRKSVKVAAAVNAQEDLLTLSLDEWPYKEPQEETYGDYTWYAIRYNNNNTSSPSDFTARFRRYRFFTELINDNPGWDANFRKIDLVRIDYVKTTEKDRKKNYSFRDGVMVRPTVTDSQVQRPRYWLESYLPFALAGGKFLLNFSYCLQSQDGNLEGLSGDFVVRCCLQVGDMSWTGSEWKKGVPNWFDIPVVGNVCEDNKKLDFYYNDYSGYIIPIDTPLHGKVLFGMRLPYTQHLSPYDSICRSISVKCIFPKYGNDKLLEENIQKIELTPAFIDAEEVKLSMTVYSPQRNPYGLGLLYAADGSYASTLGGENPEATLCSRLAAHYRQSSQLMTVRVRDGLDLQKQRLFILDGVKYSLVAYSRNYSDGSTELNLISI